VYRYMSLKWVLKRILYRVYARPKFKRMYTQFLSSQKRFKDMTAQYYLRKCFVESRGMLLEWAHRKQQKISPHTPSSARSHLFPEILDADISAAVSGLNEKGYWIAPCCLPKEWLDSVKDKMSHFKVTGRRDSSDSQLTKSLVPNEATYWYDQKDLLSIGEFSELIRDPVINEIIGRYLGCVPVYDFCVAWWSFRSASTPDSSAAQLYHFDCDRVRWLKVFIYLTDVGDANGPHAFISGSHRTIGKRIWRDGRYSDQEVFAMYGQGSQKLFTAPAGTVFIEDTMGFHKGVPVTEGSRLVFEFECSINHFGYPHPEAPFDKVPASQT